jgi:hypothetical protein
MEQARQVDAAGDGMMIGKDLLIRLRTQKYGRRMFEIAVGFGWRDDAPINEIPWRFWWSLDLDPPKLIYGPGRKIIGFCAFGWCRIFR